MKDLRNASRVGRLQFLSEDDKRDIYLAVLEILGKVGHAGAPRRGQGHAPRGRLHPDRRTSGC